MQNGYSLLSGAESRVTLTMESTWSSFQAIKEPLLAVIRCGAKVDFRIILKSFLIQVLFALLFIRHTTDHG